MQRVNVRRSDHSPCSGASKPAHRAQPSVCGRGGRGEIRSCRKSMSRVFDTRLVASTGSCVTHAAPESGAAEVCQVGGATATASQPLANVTHAGSLLAQSSWVGLARGVVRVFQEQDGPPFQVRGGRRAQTDQMVESPQHAALPCGRDRAPLGSRAYGDVSRGEVGPHAHAYPGGRVAGERGPLVTRSRRPRPQTPRPKRQPSLADHYGWSPTWTCEKCGKPWPCPAWTRRPTDPALVQALLPGFTRMASMAIRDLRGQPEGPEPAEIVKRFLWFMPLSDEEARTTALRLR